MSRPSPHQALSSLWTSLVHHTGKSPVLKTTSPVYHFHMVKSASVAITRISGGIQQMIFRSRPEARPLVPRPRPRQETMPSCPTIAARPPSRALKAKSSQVRPRCNVRFTHTHMLGCFIMFCYVMLCYVTICMHIYTIIQKYIIIYIYIHIVHKTVAISPINHS